MIFLYHFSIVKCGKYRLKVSPAVLPKISKGGTIHPKKQPKTGTQTNPQSRSGKNQGISAVGASDSADRRAFVSVRIAGVARSSAELFPWLHSDHRGHGHFYAGRGNLHDPHRQPHRHLADQEPQPAADPAGQSGAGLCHYHRRARSAGAGRDRAPHQQHACCWSRWGWA